MFECSAEIESTGNLSGDLVCGRSWPTNPLHCYSFERRVGARVPKTVRRQLAGIRLQEFVRNFFSRRTSPKRDGKLFVGVLRIIFETLALCSVCCSIFGDTLHDASCFEFVHSCISLHFTVSSLASPA